MSSPKDYIDTTMKLIHGDAYEETAEITPEEWEALKKHVAEMKPRDRWMFKVMYIGRESVPGISGLLNQK